MKRTTLKELNKKYKDYLRYEITNCKDRFGFYNAILITGDLCLATTLLELDDEIAARIEKFEMEELGLI